MAITKISQYNSSPTDETDYQAQNEHLQAFINQANGAVGCLKQSSTTNVPSIAQGAYVSMGGTLYIVDTEDYIILGSLSSGLNYIKITESGSNLTATWVQDISGYSWSGAYNCYTDGTDILLPYVVKYDGSNYYIGGFSQSNSLIIDKNGNEVLAMKIETKTVADSFNSGNPITKTFTKTITFTNDIQGIVFLDISLVANEDKAYLESFTITNNSISLTAYCPFVSVQNADYDYSITISCATN